MSERALATFLHNLLTGPPRAVGPIRDPALLQRMVARPAPPLQTLLAAHMNALLADLAGGHQNGLYPTAVPASTLWIAAALNNVALATGRPDDRLHTITLRLTAALPPAETHAAALAYHSLLRHLPRFTPSKDWDAVVHQMVQKSPLTALWLPWAEGDIDWQAALTLLAQPPLQRMVRDRLIGLLPPPDVLMRGRIATDVARSNQMTGHLLAALLAHGGTDWLPLMLTIYEADCERQRRGTADNPEWPLLTLLHQAQQSGDPLQRRNAKWLLTRYAPLKEWLHDDPLFTPYFRLDVHFLTGLAPLLPQLKFRRVS
jgi:hypothetical protein